MALPCPLRPATLCDLDCVRTELVHVRGVLKQAEARLAECEEELQEARDLIDSIRARDVDAQVVDLERTEVEPGLQEERLRALATRIPAAQDGRVR